MKTVVCMKWGTKYGPEYVNRLARGVARHLSLPHRFLCITDDPAGLDSAIQTHPLGELPFNRGLMDRRWQRAAWQKLLVFKRGFAGIEGEALFLDLDTAVLGDLDRLFSYAPGRFCIISDWMEARRAALRWIVGRYRPENGVNSSVFRFEMPRHSYVFDHLLAQEAWVYRTFRIEQTYLGAVIGERAYWPNEWVVSFKRSCRQMFPFNLVNEPTPPQRASILVFHGEPNPDQAIAGYRGPLWSRTLPAPWLKQAWS